MQQWQLIIAEKISGQDNMQTDLKLLTDFEQGLIPSTLRIYSWQPACITVGYSQEIDKLIDQNKAKALGWDIVKRPTGGGIVFHNEAEVTYSLVTALDNPLLPEGLVPSYKKLSEAIACGLEKLGIKATTQNSELKTPIPRHCSGSVPSIVEAPNSKLCFAYPAEYEVVAKGKKIVGSAQKRGKKGLLQQGSIFVKPTKKEVFSVLKNGYNGVDAISVEEILGRVPDFNEMRVALVEGFEEKLGIDFNL